MARGRRGSAVQTKLGFLIYGAFGTWKSSLCLQFAKMHREDGKPFRVLYIDGEAGSIDSYLGQYEADGVDTRNIYIIYTQSLGEVREYIKRVTNNEDLYELDEEGNETDDIVLDADNQPFRADAIVVDGTTVIYMATQQGIIEFSKKRAKVRSNRDKLTSEETMVAIEGAGLEIKDYNTLKFRGQDLILDLLASGKHFAVTARETDEKESVRGSDGKISSVLTGRKIPEGFKGLNYNVNTVLHTYIDENGIVNAIVENKDRTMVHKQNEILENPSLLDWAIVIERNKGMKDFTIMNNLQHSVQKEKEIYEKEINETMKSSDGDSSQEETKLETREDYVNAITTTVKGLSVIKRKAVMPKVKEAGLELDPKKITDIEQLKKFLEIVSA